MTNIEKFQDWFVDQVRNHGLRDMKFYSCPEVVTEEDLEEATGSMLTVLELDY